MSDAEQPNRGSVRKGVTVGIILDAVGAGLLFLIGNWSVDGLLFAFAFFLIGVTQLFWILPAVVVFALKHQRETVKGLAILTGLVALLNAACYAVVTL